MQCKSMCDTKKERKRKKKRGRILREKRRLICLSIDARLHIFNGYSNQHKEKEKKQLI